MVPRLINRDIPVHDRRNIRYFLGRRRKDCLQPKSLEQADALPNPLAVHLAERLIENDQADRIVLTLAADPAHLGEGRQKSDVEGDLRLAAGLLEQCFGKALFFPLFIRDDQVKNQISLVIGEFLHDLFVFGAALGRDIGLIENQRLKERIYLLLILFIEALRGDVPSARVHQERIHDHVVVIAVFRPRADRKPVTVRSKNAVPQRVIKFLDLSPDRLYVGLQLRNKIVPELVIGLFFGIHDPAEVFRKADVTENAEFSGVFIIILTFRIIRHPVFLIVIAALFAALP